MLICKFEENLASQNGPLSWAGMMMMMTMLMTDDDDDVNDDDNDEENDFEDKAADLTGKGGRLSWGLRQPPVKVLIKFL